MTDRPRVVVLRALGLGDLCTGIPALRALRRGLPDHRSTLLTPAPLAALAHLAEVADEVEPTAGLGRPLPSEAAGPDLAVNLHGRGPRSHHLLHGLEPRTLVGFDAGPGAPRWDDDEHEVARWCRLVREGLDLPADPTDLRIRLPPGPPPPEPAPVLVHVGASAPARRWPPGRFAALLRALHERGLPVALTGTVQELPLVHEVVERARLPPDAAGAVVAGRTDVVALARLVDGARLVVCGDTGIAHLAAALGRPSVVLFGPTSPARWGPPTDGPHAVIWRGRTGDPHGSVPDPGLCEIDVDEVLAAARRLLAGDAGR